MGVVDHEITKDLPSVNSGNRFSRKAILAQHGQTVGPSTVAPPPAKVANIHKMYVVDGLTWSGRGKRPKAFQDWADANPGQPFPTNPEWAKVEQANGNSGQAGPAIKPPSIQMQFADWLKASGKWFCLAPDSATAPIAHRWTGSYFQHVASEEGVSLALEWMKPIAPDKWNAKTAESCFQTANRDMRNTSPMPRPDKRRHIVPCQDVYLEILPSGEVIAHDPDPSFGMTHAIKIKPGTKPGQRHTLKPLAASSEFARFLEFAQPDPEIRALIQEQCGMTLLSTRFGVAAWWYGAPGSGKSTLSELCGAMQAKCGSTKLSTMTTAQFGLESLVGCGLIRVDEVEQGEKINEGLLKSLITGNGIDVDRKHEKPLVNHHFDAAFIFCSNPNPFIKDKTDAVWRRLCVIHWANAIPEASQRVTWMEEVLANEGAAILDWMLEGAIRLVKRGRFMPRAERPKAVQAMEALCRNESDSIRYWQQDNQVRVSGDKDDPKTKCHTKRAVYGHYVKWCDVVQKAPVDPQVFWRGLKILCNYSGWKKRFNGEEAERVVNIEWGDPYAHLDPL